jgi:hypothetical protein
LKDLGIGSKLEIHCWGLVAPLSAGFSLRFNWLCWLLVARLGGVQRQRPISIDFLQDKNMKNFIILK